MPILLFCTKKTNFSSYPFAHELPCTGTGNVSHPHFQRSSGSRQLVRGFVASAVVEVFVGRRKFCIMRRLHLLILLLVLPPDASGAGCKDVLDKVRGVLGSILGLG
jgi:hypothetical protein